MSEAADLLPTLVGLGMFGTVAYLVVDWFLRSGDDDR